MGTGIFGMLVQEFVAHVKAKKEESLITDET